MSETLRYRFARPEEIPDIGRLAGHSFPAASRTPDWWHEQLRDPLYGGGADTLFVGQQGSRFVAAVQIHPLRQWVGGAGLPMAGIGTVTISPTHRRRGLAAELMTQALHAARARGDVASALYPFRSVFYRRLGYGEAGVVHQYCVPPSALADAPERDGVVLLDAESAQREALALYNRWIRTQNGQLDRGEKLWAHLFSAHDRGLVGYRNASGALEGYALVVYRSDLPRRDRYLEVDELVWTTPQSRRGLHAWLASLGDQWPNVLVRTLPSHRFADWIGEPRLPHASAPGWNLWAPAATVLMGPMFRIVDMRAAWSLRTTAPAGPLAIAVDVHDEQLPENAGQWRLTFDGGQTTAERDKAAELSLRMPMSTLSRLYIGAISASAAHAAGLLVCSQPELLTVVDAALALPEPWTFDRF